MIATLYIYNIVNNKRVLVNTIVYKNEVKIYKELLGCYKRKVDKTNRVSILNIPYSNIIKASITFEKEQTGGLAKTIYEYRFEGVKI